MAVVRSVEHTAAHLPAFIQGTATDLFWSAKIIALLLFEQKRSDCRMMIGYCHPGGRNEASMKLYLRSSSCTSRLSAIVALFGNAIDCSFSWDNYRYIHGCKQLELFNKQLILKVGWNMQNMVAVQHISQASMMSALLPPAVAINTILPKVEWTLDSR